MPWIPQINNDLVFLVLSALAIGISGWGVAQLLIGLFRRENPRLEERLAGEARRELQETDRSRVIRRQNEDIPVLGNILFLQPSLVRIRQAFPGMSPIRFLMIVTICALGLAALLTAFRSPVAGVIGAAVVIFLAYITVGLRHAKRQRILADQLMDALDFLSRVLRAGHSLSTGFQMIGDELPDPIAAEFRRCHDQISLGQPIDQAMLDLAARVDSADCAFFVTSVIIQRQTGGDLAALLENISNVIRNRIRLHQHVRALTAEGRFSGYVLTALPPILFVITYILNPDYMSILLTTETGRILLAVSAGLVIVGQLMMHRITSVEA